MQKNSKPHPKSNCAPPRSNKEIPYIPAPYISVCTIVESNIDDAGPPLSRFALHGQVNSITLCADFIPHSQRACSDTS